MKRLALCLFVLTFLVCLLPAQPANTIPNLYYPAFQCQNDSSNSPVLNKLVKQVGGKCEVMATNDPLSLYIGVCSVNCGASGYSGVTWIGPVDLVTSGAVTQDHFVQIDTTGSVADAGTVQTATSVGIVENVGSAGSGAGTARVKLFSPANVGIYRTATHTSSYTATAADSATLQIMNCPGACTFTMYGTPTNTYFGGVLSIGSTAATISLNSKNFNGSSSVPVVNSFRVWSFWSDGTNYFGEAPLIAGSGESFTPASNGFTIAPVTTRRLCSIPVGDTSGSAITNAQLGPQKRICIIPANGTILEMDVAADGGTPNVIVGRNRAGTTVNIVSAALATAASGGIACSNTGGTTGIDGATTCSSTLQNTGMNAGDYLELVSGTAGGTAKLMTIQVVYTIP